MGAKAIASAIRIPPEAMNGIAKDTPVRRCCRSFLRNSIMNYAVPAGFGSRYSNVMTNLEIRHYQKHGFMLGSVASGGFAKSIRNAADTPVPNGCSRDRSAKKFRSFFCSKRVDNVGAIALA